MVRIATFGAAAVIMVAGLAWFFAPARYEAFALLRVSRQPPSVLDGGRDESRDQFDIFRRTQIQLFTSGPVVRAVVREPKIAGLSLVKKHDDPAGWLRDNLVVDYPDNTEILRVSLRGGDPEEVVKIVDAVVDKYLREIVDAERLKNLAQEGRLEKRYNEIVADFTREQEALLAMEQVARSTDSAAGEVEKRLVEESLRDAIQTRNYLNRRILENEIETNLLKLKTAATSETRTAQQDAAPEVDAAGGQLALEVLEKQRAFLEGKLFEARQQIAEETRKFERLARDTGNVTAKRKEVAALSQIMTDVKAMLDRAKIDRLAQLRITKVDDAMLVSSGGETARRWIGFAVAAIAGLGLVVVGLAAGRRPEQSRG